MEEKRFDSAEKIMEALEKERISPARMYLGFINSVYDSLADRPLSINGALAYFMDENHMKY